MLSICWKHFSVTASCLLTLFSRSVSWRVMLVDWRVGRDEQESRCSEFSVLRWQIYYFQLELLSLRSFCSELLLVFLNSFRQRIPDIDINNKMVIIIPCPPAVPTSQAHIRILISDFQFGKFIINCEFSNTLDHRFSGVDFLVAEQLPDQIGGLLLQDLLIKLEKLLFVHFGDMVGGPGSDNQVQLLHAQIFGPVQHLPPQCAQILLDGQVLHELPTVVGDHAEMIPEVHSILLITIYIQFCSYYHSTTPTTPPFLPQLRVIRFEQYSIQHMLIQELKCDGSIPIINKSR